MAQFEIRPVRPDEAEAWMAMRLEALLAHPRAFGDSYEEAAARPIAELKARLAAPGPDVVLGVFVGDALQGTAAFTLDTAAKMRHKALMGAVYLRPAVRGTGAADALIAAIVAHARQHCAVLRAVVAPTNEAARRLYFRHGFTPYGIEPRGQRLDGVDYDEELIAIVF
ncbi:GNAT family N-acetyltransferase [Caulobacter sp. KR2-114]|uniref:GNAT family N-acetyltransferase n=1 Tax=Caulobacter sp. KR2-114 TaxID=3400912 RepID=UPI003C10CD8E